MRIALGIEYDGSRFHGWQSQRGVRTVQQVLEHALSKVADQPVRVHCAGRTDTGVHASGQVVHFDTGAVREPRAWVLGGNVNLPDDVAVTWAREVPAEFHARYRAIERSYRYVILNRQARPALQHGQVTWEYRPLQVEPMQEAARHLLGEHDFSAFRAKECQARHAVREVKRLEVRRRGDYVILEVTANAFLMHMVRNFAGVLMAIGMGKAPPAWAREVLEGRDRTLGGVTAPAHGLTLVRVRYPERYGLPTDGDSPLPGVPGNRGALC